MKNRIIAALIACLVIVIVIVSVCCSYNKKRAAEEMYHCVYDVLIDYPALHSPFAATVCHFEKDGIKYLIIQNGEKAITGRQLANGETEYYYNGISYSVFNNELTENGSNVVDVVKILRLAIASLLSDETVSYTYHKPSGRDLPLWVLPIDQSYIIVERELYSDYMETMVYSAAEHKEVRWSIANSEEDTILYLYATGELFLKPILGIHGWGDIPESVTKLIVM